MRSLARGAGHVAGNRGTALLLDDRLVLRVSRHWNDLADYRLFPSRQQIDPWMMADDWANCALIELQSPLEESTLLAVGDKLLPEPGCELDGKPLCHCPCDALLGIVTAHLSDLIETRAPLTVGGAALHLCTPILYRGALLPLADDGSHIDSVLVAANYRRVSSQPRI